MATQKASIFIDTNIYLRFYDSKQSDFKKLLKSLEEIDKYIFITNQIVDEIDRNKQDLFKRGFDGYIEQSKFSRVELPEHISLTTDEKIKKWNAKRKKIEGIVKTQLTEIKAISSDMLYEILKGDDEISKVLTKISNGVTEPDDDIIERARIRKDTGNPPGKKEDPIGDQLNWELLLEYVQSEQIEDLIIISADNDYFVHNNNIVQLNAKLYKELLRVNDSLNLFCYNTLSEGLKKFNELKAIKNLPNSEVLEKIKIEEAESLQNTVSSSFPWLSPIGTIAEQEKFWIRPRSYLYPHSPYRCSKCNYQGLSPGKFVVIESKIMQEYECPHCGHTENLHVPDFSH